MRKKLLAVFIPVLSVIFISAYSQKTLAAQEASADKTDTRPEHIKLFNRGQELINAGDTDQAEVVLKKALKLAPDDAQIRQSLAGVYLQAGDKAKARDALIEIISSADFAGIKRWAAGEYYKLAEGDEGVEAAVERLEKMAGKGSKNNYLLGAIADGNARLRKWDKVTGAYTQMLGNDPADSITRTRLFDASMLSGDYDTVINALEPVVTGKADDIANSDLLAKAYTAAGRENEAIALYEKKMASRPTPGLAGRYAQALMDFGRLEEAAAQWEAAFNMDPTNLYFKQKAAETYQELGRTREAIAAYTDLRSLSPANQPWFKELAEERLKELE